jgi:uncharacterized NAD(P)/FAD-binding protein YdhS
MDKYPFSRNSGADLTEQAGFRIAIIGGGASGALMAAHLLRAAPAGIAVTIVEPRAEIGRGLAYGTGNPRHLLNVRAANMSAFPDDPGHFARWLAARSDDPDPGAHPEFRFVSRALYGCYLESLVQTHLRAPPADQALSVVRDLAREINLTSRGVEIGLAEGPPIHADVAVFACGHDQVETRSPLYVSPWTEPLGGGVDDDSNLLILGTGLTMVDTALTLDARGHRGAIIAISRRGLLPHVHSRVEPFPIDATSAPFNSELSSLLHWLRALARDALSQGHDWRCVVDGLRPHIQTIWRGMTPERRARFLAHGRPWWDTHRHRMAPEIARRIRGMIAAGRLEIIAGRVLDAVPAGQGVRVSLARRGRGTVESAQFKRIISCTGVSGDPELSTNPIVASLFANGLARGDPLRLGIAVAPDCAIVDAMGEPSRRLFAIGPMSQAAFWEITAIPDIRLQTEALAKNLLAQTRRQARAAAAMTLAGNFHART